MKSVNHEVIFVSINECFSSDVSLDPGNVSWKLKTSSRKDFQCFPSKFSSVLVESSSRWHRHAFPSREFLNKDRKDFVWKLIEAFFVCWWPSEKSRICAVSVTSDNRNSTKEKKRKHEKKKMRDKIFIETINLCFCLQYSGAHSVLMRICFPLFAFPFLSTSESYVTETRVDYSVAQEIEIFVLVAGSAFELMTHGTK